MIDTDGHVMEPASMWEDYIDPGFRANCVRVERDARNGDKLSVGGETSKRVPRLGGVRPALRAPIPDWNRLAGLDFYESYGDSCFPASRSPLERLRWMDENGIQASLLFPSLGLLWPAEAPRDESYVRANMTAYNRWLKDFCAESPTRLHGIAQTCIYGLDHAIADLKALRKEGFSHVMLPWSPPGARTCLHPTFNKLWLAAQELGISFHLHKIAIPHQLDLAVDRPIGASGTGRFFEHVNQILAGQLCLAALFDARVPDLAPRLRFAIHECNAGWVSAWLDRADESFEMCSGPGATLTAHPPSHYVREEDRFFFGMSAAERVDNVMGIWQHVVVATDFPHPGSATQPGAEWSSKVAGLSEDVRTAILFANASRLLTH